MTESELLARFPRGLLASHRLLQQAGLVLTEDWFVTMDLERKEVDKDLLKYGEGRHLQRGSPPLLVLGTISSLCHAEVKPMPAEAGLDHLWGRHPQFRSTAGNWLFSG